MTDTDRARAFEQGAEAMRHMILVCLKGDRSPNAHIIRKLVESIAFKKLPGYRRAATGGTRRSG